MTNFIRTAPIAPGKNAEALQFAGTIVDHVKAKHDRTVTVSLPIGGNPSRIAWTSTYASLAELEKTQAAKLADAE